MRRDSAPPAAERPPRGVESEPADCPESGEPQRATARAGRCHGRAGRPWRCRPLRRRPPHRPHLPHHTMPLPAEVPVVVTVHNVSVFTSPEMHGGARGTFYRSATPPRGAGDALRAEPSRAGPRATSSCGCWTPTRRPSRSPRTASTARPSTCRTTARPSACRRGWACSASPTSRFVGPARAAQEGLSPDPRLGAGRPDPPALVVAGASGWDDEVDVALAEVPERRVLRPGYLRITDLPPTSAAPRWSPTPATARASACRCWRRCRAAPPCSPPVGWRCPRSG